MGSAANQWIDTLHKQWQQLSAQLIKYLPTLFTAIILLVIGFFVAKLTRFLSMRIAQYVDHLFIRVNKIGKYDVQRRASISKLIATIIFWIVFLFFLTASLKVLGFPGIGHLFERVVEFLPNLFVAAIIVFLGYMVSEPVSMRLQVFSEETGFMHPEWVARITRVLILIFSFLIALEQLGIDINILANFVIIVIAMILASSALAFGLGISSFVSHMAALHYIKRRFHIGQQVHINTTKGQVIAFTKTAVVLDTETGETIIPGKVFHDSICTQVSNDGK